MTRSILSLFVAIGLATTPMMTRAAQTPAEAAAVDPRVHRLQTMYADAQAKVAHYEQSRDPQELYDARSLLMTWLEEHRITYGDSPAALDVRAPVYEQVRSIEARLAAAALPSPTTPPPAAVASPPETDDDTDVAGRGLIGGGASMLAMGAAGVLGVGMPFWALRSQSIDEADRAHFRVDQEEHLDRARRRETTAVTMFAMGGVLAAGGVLMLAGGVVMRARARRHRMAVTPQLGPGFAGASATVRF